MARSRCYALTAKFTTDASRPGIPLPRPWFSNQKYIQEKQASKYYNAITIGIDFTARDIQNELKKKGLPWEKAKAWDNSAVVANWIDVTPDMLRKSVQFSLKKNGELVQTGDTKDMIFTFNEVISHISNFFSLNIGDLVFTGTPAGVGECVVGDVLEGFIEDQKMFELEIK